MKIFLCITIIILLGITVLVFTGCTGEAPETSSSNTDITSTITPYWTTVNGTFITRDYARAQNEIPFTLLLPSYLPIQREEPILPDIQGPLRESQSSNGIQVEIYYIFELNDTCIIRIIETNIEYSPGNHPIYPYSEIISIRNTEVLKINHGDVELGPFFSFTFGHNNLYYIVETYNLPEEEGIKTAESMIEQFE